MVDLREKVIPAAVAGTGLEVNVTGTAAVNVDSTDYLSRKLLVFFGSVLMLSFVLLMVVFRSVLVPLEAVVMNILSIGAAFGVVVADAWSRGADDSASVAASRCGWQPRGGSKHRVRVQPDRVR